MAHRKVEFHPEAIDDASEARHWYASRSALADERFVNELDRAVEKIGESPHRFPQHIGSTRRFLFDRFPYMLVYQERDADIWIVAVAHARRRPGFWRKRLRE